MAKGTLVRLLTVFIALGVAGNVEGARYEMSKAKYIAAAAGGTATLEFDPEYKMIEGTTKWYNPKWAKISTDLVIENGDARMTIRDDFALIISNLTLADEGTYSVWGDVTADHHYSRTVNLQVVVPPQVISISDDNINILGEGDDASIICSVSGKPTPSIKWFFTPHRGVKVEFNREFTEPTESTVRYGTTVDVGGEPATLHLFTSKLELHNLVHSDNGVYECRAENRYGLLASETTTLALKIEVCDDGFWGERCEDTCPQQCAKCERLTGKCEMCKVGFYGESCGSCPSSCRTLVCDMTSGACSDGCVFGMHGAVCDKDCSKNCERGYCEQADGTCKIGCKTGFYGSHCDQSCPSCQDGGCERDSGECLVMCATGYYGKECEKTCPSGCECKCDKTTGECSSCQVGFFGDLCDKECPRNCGDGCHEMPNKGTGVCNGGCLVGFYGEHCHNTCPANCISFECDPRSGDCLMDGCKVGFYGNQCELKCVAACPDFCDRTSGFCSSCETGFYGKHCELTCSEHCLGKRCDQFGGQCSDGCVNSYTGVFCHEKCGLCSTAHCTQDGECPGPCQIGYFGKDCLQKCPVTCQCMECDRLTGECSDGCKDGYTGKKCEETFSTLTDPRLRRSLKVRRSVEESAAAAAQSSMETESSNNLAIGLGATAIAVLVLVLIALVTYKFVWKTKCSRSVIYRAQPQ